LLSIRGLRFGYSRQGRQFDGLDLELPRGDILGLVGPNGAGKTTLVSLIGGLLTPAAGSIAIAGTPARLGRRDLALVPQEYAFYSRLSGRENLSYFAAAAGFTRAEARQRVDQVIAESGLAEVADKRAASYSGGLKRRLNFAIAILRRPDLLILDEPTANVDPHSRALLLNQLRRLNDEGVTILYTSHLLGEVESFCRSLAVMSQGRLVWRGTMSDLLAGQSQRLTVQLSGPLPQALRDRPGVWPEEGGRWCLDLEMLQQTPMDILRELETAGLQIQQISYGQRRLEEVFLALTQMEAGL
jgi:ABC-2 type transport system ATP-binding protein